jgi:hypothetical protein
MNKLAVDYHDGWSKKWRAGEDAILLSLAALFVPAFLSPWFIPRSRPIGIEKFGFFFGRELTKHFEMMSDNATSSMTWFLEFRFTGYRRVCTFSSLWIPLGFPKRPQRLR